MYTALLPLLSLAPSHPLLSTKATALAAFSTHERALQLSSPTLPYNRLLSLAYASFASSLQLAAPSPGECEAFAASIPSWPAFPDTVAALISLQKHYKLVILSNIDNASIAKTLSGPLAGVEFDAVYTAEDIGSFKPALANFEYLVERVEKDFGIGVEGVLHTANSLRADHVPAMEMRITSAWIDRGLGEEELGGYRGEVGFTWRFGGMGDMAREVDGAFGEGGG